MNLPLFACAMALLAAGLWWLQRDPLYSTYALAAAFGVLRFADRLIDNPPLPWPLWGAVAAGLMVGMVVGLSGAFASEWSMLSMYLLFIAVITFRARGLFGRKSILDN